MPVMGASALWVPPVKICVRALNLVGIFGFVCLCFLNVTFCFTLKSEQLMIHCSHMEVVIL